MTFLTADLDRLIGFYERVFGARVTFDRVEEDPPRRRHALIDVGGQTLLHPFQVDGVDIPASQPIFGRGHLDHFAFTAADEDAFREIRHRLIAEGAYAIEGGLVTDMGPILSLSYHDPDGLWCEVMCVKPGASFSDGFNLPADWRMIELD